jgi:hypothetical protein
MAEMLPQAPEEPTDDNPRGLRHLHESEVVTGLAALQSAHHWLHWDVGRSRILSVGVCRICGEPDRQSVQECTDADCHAHRICQRPYR